MNILRGVVVVALLAAVAAVLPAQSRTFPVDDIKPGMVGIGRTFFEGDRLEEFKVHMIGVLRNSIGPRRNLILARLEGGPLANTGVIAGMIGSPVYIDGRLIGAVSYSLGQFSKEPIAGITPISEMVEAATLPWPRRQAAIACSLRVIAATSRARHRAAARTTTHSRKITGRCSPRCCHMLRQRYLRTVTAWKGSPPI